MTIMITCSQCARQFKLKDAVAGKKGKCRCGAVIRIPPKDESPAPPVGNREHPVVNKRAKMEVLPPKLPDSILKHGQSPAAAESCTTCGQHSTEGSLFCQWCGIPLSNPAV